MMPSLERHWNALAALAMVVSVYLLDLFVTHYRFFEDEVPPSASDIFLVRTTLLAVAAVLSLRWLVKRPGPSMSNAPRAGPQFLRRLPWLTAILAVFFTFVFYLSPREFYSLGREDRLIEHASAMASFAAAGYFLWLIMRMRATRPRPGLAAQVCGLGLAVVFLLIGFEEVSWFQRALKFDTPEFVLQLSQRNELNFHNMYTALAEAVYYVGSFVLLIVLPLVRERTSWLKRFENWGAWLPDRTVLLAAAPAFAFNYVYWNAPFAQFPFWFTLAVLVMYAWEAVRKPDLSSGERALPVSVLAVFVFVQVVFLLGGSEFVRIWDASEYKELLIPLGFLVYAINASRRIAMQLGLTETGPLLASLPMMVASVFALLSINFAVGENVTQSELDVLALAKQFANPDWLPGDWQLNEPVTARLAFVVVLYPLVKFLPLVAVSIIGRLTGFAILSLGLAMIGRRIRLNAPTVCVAVGIYIWLGQSFLDASDSLFKRFEAHVLAYGFLLLALNALLDRRLKRTAVFAGLATSFHFLVGGWGTLALALTAWSQGVGVRRERLIAIGYWFAAASVAMYYVATVLLEPTVDTIYDLDHVYIFYRNAGALVPQTWNWELAEVAAAAALGWVLVRARFLDPVHSASRLVSEFVLWTLVSYFVALLLSPFDFALKILHTYPFRVPTTLLQVIGLLFLVRWLARWLVHADRRNLLALVAAGFFFWVGAERFADGFVKLQAFPRGAYSQNGGGSSRARAIYDVCEWIDANTERNAVVLTTPTRGLVAYLCNRAVAVRWKSVAYTQAGLAKWYGRLTAFNGGDEPGRNTNITKTFRRLEADDYRRLARDYGGYYLLIKREMIMGLERIYANDRYSVYWLGEHDWPGRPEECGPVNCSDH